MTFIITLSYKELLELTKRLALALADDAVFHGDNNMAEATLGVLSDAREELGLSEEFDELDSLASPTQSAPQIPIV